MSGAEWSAPAGSLPAGAVSGAALEFGKRTCKPNSVVCGHSSRRRVAADTHQRPTRRFRHCMEQPFKAPFHARSRLTVPGRHGTPPCSRRASPSLFGLAPCGVYPASGFTVGAVRSYRTFSPLPRSWAPQVSILRPGKDTISAVCSLWHWPSTGLNARVPDVIRHTALRSSDFPPPACAKAHSGSDRPVLLPELV